MKHVMATLGLVLLAGGSYHVGTLLNSAYSVPLEEVVLKKTVELRVKNSEKTDHCTGAILPDGQILTAAHCRVAVEGDKEFVAYYRDGETRKVDIARARYHAKEAQGDLMLLKTSEGHPEKYPVARPYCKDLPVGSKVMATGHPGPVMWAVTTGQIVSKRPRVSDKFKDVWIIHDAVIWKGMSGGPVFDTEGRLVGTSSHGQIGRIAMRQAVNTGLQYAVDGPEICDFLED